MTDFAKIFNIYSTESGLNEEPDCEHIKRANARKIKKKILLN